jgi:hypothetical protein
MNFRYFELKHKTWEKWLKKQNLKLEIPLVFKPIELKRFKGVICGRFCGHYNGSLVIKPRRGKLKFYSHSNRYLEQKLRNVSVGEEIEIHFLGPKISKTSGHEYDAVSIRKSERQKNINQWITKKVQSLLAQD